MDKEYNVTFIADYFTMTVTLQGVETTDEDDIVDLACNTIIYHYGFNVMLVATEYHIQEVEVEV